MIISQVTWFLFISALLDDEDAAEDTGERAVGETAPKKAPKKRMFALRSPCV